MDGKRIIVFGLTYAPSLDVLTAPGRDKIIRAVHGPGGLQHITGRVGSSSTSHGPGRVGPGGLHVSRNEVR